MVKTAIRMCERLRVVGSAPCGISGLGVFMCLLAISVLSSGNFAVSGLSLHQSHLRSLLRTNRSASLCGHESAENSGPFVVVPPPPGEKHPPGAGNSEIDRSWSKPATATPHRQRPLFQQPVRQLLT